MPVLTPIGLDPSHPFPRVLNKSLNFAVELEGTDAFGRNSGAAIVQAPRALPRVIRLPKELCGVDYGFVFLSSILHEHVSELFTGMNVLGCYQFRVTRNSDLFVDDEEVKNLRIALQGELPQRHFGDAVRLEVADNCSELMTEFLLQQFGLDDDDLYRVPGIVNLVRLMSVPDQVDRPDLMYAPFQPGLPKVLAKRYDIFSSIRKHDILIHHPFQSFTPVIQLLQQAADDPQVVAIKMTVYRTGTDSVLMEHLLRAAERARKSPWWWNSWPASTRKPTCRSPPPRRGRRPCRLWRGRLQDPCQDADGVAPRGSRLSPLHPPRHRQLPSAHHALLYRLRPADFQHGNRRRRQRGIQAAYRPRQGHCAETPVAGAFFPALKDARRRSAAKSTPHAPATRAHHRQDELLLEPEIIDRALRSQRGRRQHRPDRARRLLAAPGESRGSPKISGCAR
jgi:hypothetical protein